MIDTVLAWLSNTLGGVLAKVPWLNRLEPDKRVHVVAGVIAWAVVMLVTRSPLTAAVFVFVLASLKEWWYDARHPEAHTVDWTDMMASTLPAIVLSLVWWVL